MNPFIFNLFNGIIFTLAGIWAYTQEWEYAPYFIGLGLLLIVLTYFVRSSNKILGSLAMLSTLLSTIILGVIFYFYQDSADFTLTSIAMMATSGFVTSLAFIQCAVGHNKGETSSSQCCEKGVESQTGGCC